MREIIKLVKNEKFSISDFLKFWKSCNSSLWLGHSWFVLCYVMYQKIIPRKYNTNIIHKAADFELVLHPCDIKGDNQRTNNLWKLTNIGSLGPGHRSPSIKIISLTFDPLRHTNTCYNVRRECTKWKGLTYTLSIENKYETYRWEPHRTFHLPHCSEVFLFKKNPINRIIKVRNATSMTRNLDANR